MVLLRSWERMKGRNKKGQVEKWRDRPVWQHLESMNSIGVSGIAGMIAYEAFGVDRNAFMIALVRLCYSRFSSVVLFNSYRRKGQLRGKRAGQPLPCIEVRVL